MESPMIRVVAICGSLRKASTNRGLIRSAIQLCNDGSVDGMHIEYVDISPLPFLNTDLERGASFPPPVEAFRRKVRGADSILFASPEYNYSFTGRGWEDEGDIDKEEEMKLYAKMEKSASTKVRGLINRTLKAANRPDSPLKNAIDWASRAPNVWADKPAAIVSSGGGFGGGRSQYHLRQVGVYLDLHFINKPELFVKEFEPPQKFDSEGNLIDPETTDRLRNVLLSLQAFTYRLQSKS